MYAVESILKEPRFKFENEAAKAVYHLACVFLESKEAHRGVRHAELRFNLY